MHVRACVCACVCACDVRSILGVHLHFTLRNTADSLWYRSSAAVRSAGRTCEVAAARSSLNQRGALSQGSEPAAALCDKFARQTKSLILVNFGREWRICAAVPSHPAVMNQFGRINLVHKLSTELLATQDVIIGHVKNDLEEAKAEASRRNDVTIKVFCTFPPWCERCVQVCDHQAPGFCLRKSLESSSHSILPSCAEQEAPSERMFSSFRSHLLH